MRCPKCGRVNREDAIYCWNCHVKFSELKEKKSESERREVKGERQEREKPSDSKKKATYLLIGLGIALIIILGLTAYFILKAS
jgi:uncharacterized membrane protein YvbJ